MSEVVSLPSRTQEINSNYHLSTFRDGLKDYVSVWSRSEFGTTLLVSMEIGPAGRIIMQRFMELGVVSSDR